MRKGLYDEKQLEESKTKLLKKVKEIDDEKEQP